MLYSKKMQSFVVMIILVLITFIGVVSGCSNNNKYQKLSELDDDLLIQRLTDHEIMIPENLETSVIRNAVADLEVDPNRPSPPVSWTAYLEFYEELRGYVKEYYAKGS
ncbi:hypothetical protein P261_02706 [Lachnospiraceae bacterium TWA4]|nr:hypothetical protein P261_02706 [Lachnospiraceae bacterium TWA4]